MSRRSITVNLARTEQTAEVDDVSATFVEMQTGARQKTMEAAALVTIASVDTAAVGCASRALKIRTVLPADSARLSAKSVSTREATAYHALQALSVAVGDAAGFVAATVCSDNPASYRAYINAASRYFNHNYKNLINI